ncbi:hypothetical protein LFM09_10165 [Lentzea alba]|uniref:hypothetical protein n=1 Tax=Lentzea alba TaxID=2714351 RepID=UPI0039BFC931
MSGDARVLHWMTVCPYVSVTVLECTADDLPAAFGKLRDHLITPGRGRSGRQVEIVATSDDLDVGQAAEDVDQLTGFVRQQRDRPTWATSDAGFEDTVHRLTIALRRRRLIAVHCDTGSHDRLQRWLDKAPKPPFKRIPPRVLEGALHRGDAKSLWLRGVHQPRTTKPDIKNTGGLRLQDTISPADDGSYAVGAARSELPESPDRLVLKGIVGSTPGESSAWFKAAPDFPTFVTAVCELLGLIEKELAAGSGEEAFPHFAREIFDLAGVTGAYEVRAVPAAHLRPDASPDLLDAAALLENAVLDVTGRPDSARFSIDVGLNNAISGQLKGGPKAEDTRFTLDIGHCGAPTDPEPVRQVLSALEYADELLTVYYSSGHTLAHGRIWAERPRDFPFPNWSFEDFTGYKIEREKPPFRDPQSIHDQIAEPGDSSLFAWVVNRYRDGWLICDDGPGETADFLYVSTSGDLSLIHVKGARSAATRRRVALGPFEVVVSQALKNLVYTQPDLLKSRLSAPSLDRPACWDLGVRSGSRAEFLDALEARDSSRRTEVVIVQPHMSRAIHGRLRGRASPTTEDSLRLMLLDELLNAARSTITGAATDLVVVGSLV